jgi:hypothetical protein
MEQLGSHWTDLMKFDTSVLFENLLRKFGAHCIEEYVGGGRVAFGYEQSTD